MSFEITKLKIIFNNANIFFESLRMVKTGSQKNEEQII